MSNNFSNAKFAINRKAQSTKDIADVSQLVRYPFLYGNNSGFIVSPEADNYGDVVDPILESSKTQILGAVVQGGVEVPADASFIGLILGSMLGTVNTSNPTAGVYSHAITPTSSADPNFHTCLYSDGTCDNRIVGAVPTSLALGADFQNKRMNAQVGFTAIRMEDNDGTASGTATVVAATDIWTVTGHAFTDGDAVQVTNSGGGLPAGVSALTTYYVEVIDANTLYLHTTYNGAISHTTADVLNATTAGTGTHTVARYIVAYPSQNALNPFHFINTGALLTLNKNAAGAVDYTTQWAGFAYTLQDVVAAEQRAGSNTFRQIQRVDRTQSLSLVFDYTDTTFKDIIRDYQKKTSPDQYEIILKLQGKLIGATTYNYSMQFQFYNCNLINHDYTKNPEIGKQSLAFSVNHDLTAGKSITATVVNDVATYLS